ncbi:MAG TPA: type II secretion system F family protein [Candidatus Blautia intestinipullorum]|nr:type II secretion system F family protein [Candidatus Blautia intestinipullorum]
MINYHVYYMSQLEKIIYFLAAFIAGGAVGYLFYGGIGKDEFGDPTVLTYILNFIVIVVCGTVAGKLFLPIRNQQIVNSRKKKLKSQFRDMLEALATSLGSGKNVQDSFRTAYEDLTNQYDEGAFILHELKVINSGVLNGINIEELISDFGKRSACTDIEDFAGVFEVCYRRGGNIRETIHNTCRIIVDKMAVSQEIETTVAGSKNEQYIMLVMPICLVGMIKMSSPEFAANFATPSGVISTTIAIALFVVSYFIGRKLLDIKV